MGTGSTNAAASGAAGVAARMGLKPAMIVMEIGYDDDVDDDLRDSIEEHTGEEIVDEDSDEVVDVVLLWYRDGDGDLADLLVDAIGPLADDGVIWLLTPKRGRAGYVEPSDITEAASIAGLSADVDRYDQSGLVGHPPRRPAVRRQEMIQVGDEAPGLHAARTRTTRSSRSRRSAATQAVLIVFYPLAFTGICTGELCAVRDDMPTFENDDVQTVSISVDSVYSHKIFAEREGYEFPLLADFWPHGGVAQALRRVQRRRRHRQPRHVPRRQGRHRPLRRDEQPGRGTRRRRVARGDQVALTTMTFLIIVACIVTPMLIAAYLVDRSDRKTRLLPRLGRRDLASREARSADRACSDA